MPISYLNHYQDSVDRHNEYLDLVTRLAQISQDIGNISGGGGSPVGCIGTSITKYSVPYTLNNDPSQIQGIDLIQLLNVQDGYYNLAYPNKINVEVYDNSVYSPEYQILEAGGEFYYEHPTEPWFKFDFYDNQIELQAIAWQMPSNSDARPLEIVIMGSNDDISYDILGTWTTVVSNPYYWDSYILPVQSIPYKYLKLQSNVYQIDNKLWLSGVQVKFYGNLILG